MIKFYFTSLFILVFSFGFSQSYPYLNASTGNKDEYPVDKDTNIYMFQGGRLTKTDKNFNVIWSNVYSGMSFTNLLLSKTGSMYFLSGTSYPSKYFGKINPNGNLAWIRSVSGLMATISGTVFTGSNPDCLSLLLDAGNNLLVSGNMYLGSSANNSTAYILKCDTNGLALKFKAFKLNYGQDLIILNDSAGVYKLLGSGAILSSTLFMIHSYSDVTDNFINYKAFGIAAGSGPSYTNWKAFRSKLRSTVFYMDARVTTSVTDYNGVVKVTDNAQVQWTCPLSTTAMGYYNTIETMEEDNKGNVLASLSCGGSCPSYTSAFVRMDSNGLKDPFFTTMLKGYPVTSFQLPKHSPRVIHEGNYYFDIWGYSFPANPLTVQKFNSSLLLPCASTMAATSNGVGAGPFPIFSSGTIIPVSSYTLGVSPSITVTASTFTIDPNFCIVLGVDPINGNSTDKLIYPNPSNERIYLGSETEKVEVFDVNGKNLIKASNVSELNISELPNGIYFIRIKTDKGNFNKKFIKE